MKREGGLFEKVADFGVLREAALRAARGKRKSADVCEFLLRLESECVKLERELKEGSYRPGPYRSFFVYERKPRRICAAPFRDRVVHHALCAAMEPRLEASFIYDSYACRKGKGTLKALQRSQEFARGRGYVLHLDVEKYFESIRGEIVMKQTERLIKDKRFLGLLRSVVENRPEGMADGLPIGNLTSQWLANAYLGGLDHWIKQVCEVRRYLRYMDDFLLFSESKEELWEWKENIEAYLKAYLGLALKESETRLTPVWEGFCFLGFRVYPKMIRFGQRGERRFAQAWRKIDRAVLEGAMSEEEGQRRVRGLMGHALAANTCRWRQSLLEKRPR